MSENGLSDVKGFDRETKAVLRVGLMLYISTHELKNTLHAVVCSCLLPAPVWTGWKVLLKALNGLGEITLSVCWTGGVTSSSSSSAPVRDADASKRSLSAASSSLRDGVIEERPLLPRLVGSRRVGGRPRSFRTFCVPLSSTIPSVDWYSFSSRRRDECVVWYPSEWLGISWFLDFVRSGVGGGVFSPVGISDSFIPFTSPSSMDDFFGFTKSCTRTVVYSRSQPVLSGLFAFSPCASSFAELCSRPFSVPTLHSSTRSMCEVSGTEVCSGWSTRISCKVTVSLCSGADIKDSFGWSRTSTELLTIRSSCGVTDFKIPCGWSTLRSFEFAASLFGVRDTETSSPLSALDPDEISPLCHSFPQVLRAPCGGNIVWGGLSCASSCSMTRKSQSSRPSNESSLSEESLGAFFSFWCSGLKAPKLLHLLTQFSIFSTVREPRPGLFPVRDTQDSFLGGVLWAVAGFSSWTDIISSALFGSEIVDVVFCRRFFLAASGGCGGGGRGTVFPRSSSRRCCRFFLGGGIGVLFSSWVSGTLSVASSHLEDVFWACVVLMCRCVVWIGTGWLTSGLLLGLKQQV